MLTVLMNGEGILMYQNVQCMYDMSHMSVWFEASTLWKVRVIKKWGHALLERVQKNEWVSMNS